MNDAMTDEDPTSPTTPPKLGAFAPADDVFNALESVVHKNNPSTENEE